MPCKAKIAVLVFVFVEVEAELSMVEVSAILLRWREHIPNLVIGVSLYGLGFGLGLGP